MEGIDPQLLAALLQQMQGGQAPQQPDPMGAMSPEEIAQFSGMGSLDDRMGLEQQAQARAEALRNYEAPRMSTPGGAIGMGMGDLFREVGGGIGSMRAGNQMQDILGQQDAGRGSYMSKVAALLRKGAPEEKTVDLSGLIASGGF